MGLSRWWRARVRLSRARQAREARLHRAVQEVVDIVDPRMRGLAGYDRKLAPAIENAARFVGEMIESLPEPVLIARDRWAVEPCLRACFASVDAMQELFDNDRGLRKFMAGAAGRGATEIYATVGMRIQRHKRHGYALQGDMVQQGVEQVAVNFADHRIGVIAANENEFRTGLLRRILEELSTRAMQRIVGMRTRKEALSEEQAILRWKLKVYEMREQGLETLWRDKDIYERHAQDLRERLNVTDANLDDLVQHAGNIEHFLEATVDEFEKAPEMIRVEPLSMWLNDMNLEVAPSAPGARQISLVQIRVGRRRPGIVQMVKFAADFPRVDTGEALRKAARALGV